ncbi:MAG TPA: nucleotidyltransferase family protein [Bryobacteraceae bacterium]|jgi:hypothetical protein
MITPAMRAAFAMLSGRGPAPASILAEWNELLAFTDRFQLTLHLRGIPGLPPRVEEEIDARLEKNRKRRERLCESYRAASRALDEAGVAFALLKGLTHETGFGVCPENRVQYDLDLLCRPEDYERAREALRRIGYAPHGGRSLSAEHGRPLVQPFEWKWRGDYYDPDMPIPIELHDSIWSAAQDRIRIDSAAFWKRRTILHVNGLAVPALSDVDRAGFAALHVLRHVLRNDARPAHAFELAQLLRARGEDDPFWAGWRQSREARLSVLESAGFRFAAEWFAVRGKLPRTREQPEKIEVWFRNFAWSPIANLAGGNKDALWLHLALLDNWGDRARVVCRRLAPLRLPHANASFGGRLRYHAAALGPTLFNGLRWWWGRDAGSTAPRLSDWKRGSA